MSKAKIDWPLGLWLEQYCAVMIRSLGHRNAFLQVTSVLQKKTENTFAFGKGMLLMRLASWYF